VKKWTKKVVEAVQVHSSRLLPVTLEDLRGKAVSSRSADYANGPVLLEVQCNMVYHLSVFPLDARNAWVIAASALGGSGSSKDNRRRASDHLSAHFASVQHISVSQFLNLEDSGANDYFRTSAVFWAMPLESALSPWSENILSKEYPVDQLNPSRATNDVSRMASIRDSVLKTGYRRSALPDGDIEVEALVNTDGTERYQLISGNHRAAVLVSLGYENLTVRVISVVRREDSDVWPKVRSGLFSQAQARDHFDQYFSPSRSPRLPGRLLAESVEDEDLKA
jgi:hypothetical protein